ncbi:hypothetical protein GCM10011352_10410 [Marinobacterium zhoushanense]|uniref:Type II methyltransferase M.TaqI-like domain-containing protein n=1 Tax=Marinobacterium zhoushanense TaxID=1679163 RepID=A0ABQ1K8U4_9GAMM|nr:class I SAM-dependent methyltransferase [Marinobacterium zhoushanense]GGB86421.1 hypothetical protein GCM10011352_10410 [Marinobacterium zhoushanense]
MIKHYTPDHLVSIIRKHLPKRITSILEPSVGNGALIHTLPDHRKSLCSITAIDQNGNCIDYISNEFDNKFKNVNFLRAEFLSWYEENKELYKDTYDLVLMNPPFSAKLKSWIYFDGSKQPIELAFLKAAIQLCKSGGSIIAIVPKSIISSENKHSHSFRSSLINQYSVEYVYELESFDFPSIEGQFYILVIKKSQNSRSMALIGSENDRIILKKNFLKNSNYRLDFSYHDSTRIYNSIVSRMELPLTKIHDLFDIYRGSSNLPFKNSMILHTSSYKDGHWNHENSSIANKNSAYVYANKNDLILKRVGRNCVLTFGIYLLERRQIISDCILILRSKGIVDPIEALFSIRSIYANSLGRKLLQKGTGAQYITINSLGELLIPIGVDKKFNDEFYRYKKLCLKNDSSGMEYIEKRLMKRILKNDHDDGNIYTDNNLL